VSVSAALVAPAGAQGQESPAAASLAAALVAACRQNADEFAQHLTEENAAEFRRFSAERRVDIMRRFVLQSAPGRPLLSNDADGRPIVRCDSGGQITELRLAAERARDNLAFITVEVSRQREAEFGMVREGGAWKILSLGLLLLNLRELARQWDAPSAAAPPKNAEAPEAPDDRARRALLELRAAVLRYRSIFGALPERLEHLGPPEANGVSPERARLIGSDLAAGRRGGYAFAYRLLPAEKPGGEPGFALTATPLEYDKSGRLSFYVDASGILRGGNKQGAVATSDDPRLTPP
jgi:hypothetical protein